VAAPYFRAEGLEPLAFFANPNIQPPDEHDRRLQSMRDYAAAVGLELVVDGGAGVTEWAAGPGRPDALSAPVWPTPVNAAGSASRCGWARPPAPPLRAA